MKTFGYIFIVCLCLIVTLSGCVSGPVKKQATLNKQKLELVSEITYQLKNSTNPVARIDYTEKLLNLVGEPNLVDTRKTNFDKDISKLQKAEDRNQLAMENQAEQAIELKAELAKYHKYFGLMAIVLGAIQFVKTSLWFLFGFIVIFIILRVLAATNPLANAIFGIAQSFGATCIHLIEALIPSSITTLEITKQDVNKVADTIAEVRNSNGK